MGGGIDARQQGNEHLRFADAAPTDVPPKRRRDSRARGRSAVAGDLALDLMIGQRDL